MLSPTCVRSSTTIGCEIKKALVLTTSVALGDPFPDLKIALDCWYSLVYETKHEGKYLLILMQTTHTKSNRQCPVSIKATSTKLYF